ncbi:cysteine dioxygenase family protein [Calothrix sp. 336/3]|uniref:cysteine dioxygenase family protein n=1 Tax=Calothrix sp. 336/3 TaxID=1337936 RepID=UPI0004E2FB46|nr:cupin [Calothrix sp. 336/3]AKG22367.1 cupin [Calothrix sp. 336/3]
MQSQDYLLTGNGKYQTCQKPREWNLLRENYRLYRFLTELEDILKDATDESLHLAEIRMLVRRLIVNSYWVRSQYPEPCQQTGTSVLLLYDELGFPFTIQTVTFTPGTKSNIHNHGTWGIVAILQGQEKNTFWQKINDKSQADKIEKKGELILSPGDIISFTSDAIHSVEAVGDIPTVTFNLYGETSPESRFAYNPLDGTAKRF